MFSYTLAQSLIPFFGKYGELFQGLAGIEGCLRASGSVKPDSRVLVIIDWVLVIILEFGCCPYGVCSGGCAVAGLPLFPCMHVYRSLHNAYIKTPPSICGPLIVRAPPPTSARFSAINNHARLSPSFITKPQTRPHNGSLHSFSPASRTHSLTRTRTHRPTPCTSSPPPELPSAQRTAPSPPSPRRNSVSSPSSTPSTGPVSSQSKSRSFTWATSSRLVSGSLPPGRSVSVPGASWKKKGKKKGVADKRCKKR